jgi:NADH-quinone oxidoreductase subunit D
MHDYTIPIGPQHPSIDEPTCIRISLDGNYIVDAKIRLGYVHRGIEKLLEGKTVEQGLQIVDHICGICSVAHPSCYTSAVEKILNYEPPERVKYLRTLVGELARIQSHLFWTGFMLHELGFETMLAYFLRDREHILEVLERITGNRVHFAYHKIRSVRNDINEDDVKFTLEKIKKIEKQVPVYVKTVETDGVIRARLMNVGVISRIDADKYSLIGPIARASGIRTDIRKDDTYEAYDKVDFELVTELDGDAYARAFVRLREILESIKIVKQVLKDMPKGDVPQHSTVMIEEGMETGRVEAPRGENFHLIKIKDRRIDRARIRPPTFNFMNIFTKLLIGREIGDVPVILASLDPCFACMERVVIVKDGKTEVLTESDFKHKYL